MAGLTKPQIEALVRLYEQYQQEPDAEHDPRSESPSEAATERDLEYLDRFIEVFQSCEAGREVLTDYAELERASQAVIEAWESNLAPAVNALRLVLACHAAGPHAH